jgi:hypothetical protein
LILAYGNNIFNEEGSSETMQLCHIMKVDTSVSYCKLLISLSVGCDCNTRAFTVWLLEDEMIACKFDL